MLLHSVCRCLFSFYYQTECVFFPCALFQVMHLLAALPASLNFSYIFSFTFIASCHPVCMQLSFCLMLLQVKDQEFPFNRDLARILVAVVDSNDNIPYFTSTAYEAVTYESSPVGTSVLQVTALDKDSGINGLLMYTIESGLMLSAVFMSACAPADVKTFSFCFSSHSFGTIEYQSKSRTFETLLSQFNPKYLPTKIFF